MRKFTIFSVILMGLVFLSTCTLKNPTDPKLPSWVVNLEFPLLKDHVTLKEIAKDSLITTMPVSGAPGESLFVFKDSIPIDSVEVGNQLNIDDIHKHFTQTVDDVTIDSDQKHDEVGFDEVRLDDVTKNITSEVGPIELNNTDPKQSDVFTFREIMPQSIVDDLDSQTQGGNTYTGTIPSGTLRPSVKTFQFESFQSVLLDQGQLVMTIHNNMFIPLGEPITVSLLYHDQDSTQFGQAVYDEYIPVGGSLTRTIDLSGDSLGSDIYIQVSGESDGSQGSDVTIENSDLNRGFYVEVEAQNMVASEADAQIPSQQITQDDQIELAESENKIEEATLQDGDLNLSITNNLSVDSDVILRVPSLVDVNGDEFERGPFTVTANNVADQSYDISGYTMVMDTASQIVDYNYEVNTVDTGNEYRVINQNDSVNVQVDLANMTISEILGVLEPKRTVEDGDIPITSDNEILKATIDEGSITLNIDNQIGGEPHLKLKLHQLFQTPGSNDTIIHEMDIDPGQNQAVIPLNNAEIRMPRNDQTLYYTTVTTGGGVYAQYDITDSISVDIEVSELLISEATGYFTQDAMVEEDTISLDNETKVQEAVIDSGQLQMRIVNNIGVEAKVRLILDEFYSGGTSLDTVINIPETSEPTVRTIPLSQYIIQMPLNDQNIHYTSRTRLLQDSLMTLSLDDSISVNVDITGLSFSEVTGEIDPVHIDISPVEQEVTGIPEELDGVNFSTVDMEIDFETNIGIPVFLDLTIKSYNDEGDTVINDAVRGWDITDSSTVIIPDAEDLINIFPSFITASGQATAGAPGLIGQVASNQYVRGQLQLSAPLEFTITDDAVVNLDPQKVDPIEEDVRNRVKRLTLYARMDNQFEFGAQVHVLSAKDTLAFDGGASQIPDTLAVLNVPAGMTSLDSVDLDTSKISLFSDSSYVKTRVKMLPMSDGSPSRFLSTDSLHMNLYGKVRYLNDHLKDQ